MTPEKNWNFIKNHSHHHAVQDILNKGVTKNFNTKIFEILHGALKAAYLAFTNFKDVAPKVYFSYIYIYSYLLLYNRFWR